MKLIVKKKRSSPSRRAPANHLVCEKVRSAVIASIASKMARRGYGKVWWRLQRVGQYCPTESHYATWHLVGFFLLCQKWEISILITIDDTEFPFRPKILYAANSGVGCLTPWPLHEQRVFSVALRTGISMYANEWQLNLIQSENFANEGSDYCSKVRACCFLARDLMTAWSDVCQSG